MTNSPSNRERITLNRGSCCHVGWQVAAASRLHFGLMGFESSECPFGGVGMMVRAPQTMVQIASSDVFVVRGCEHSRVRGIVQQWANFHCRPMPSDCSIDVPIIVPRHRGLGSGTQLALSIASALNAFYEVVPDDFASLVRSVARGRRSAVGSWGFRCGGLVVELGSTDTDRLGQLEVRHDVPTDWRVMLAWPSPTAGLHGVAEETAFSQLPRIGRETTATLKSIALCEIAPALADHDFDRFSRGVYKYGMTSGNCFAKVQGGPFASKAIADLIHNIRRLGVRGVGQSSWGPTVFAFLRDANEAKWLRDRLRGTTDGDLQFLFTSACNRGATLQPLHMSQPSGRNSDICRS